MKIRSNIFSWSQKEGGAYIREGANIRGNTVRYTRKGLLCMITFQVVGMFPDIGSKFVVVYGMEAFLDPFLIMIVDCILLVLYSFQIITFTNNMVTTIIANYPGRISS